MVLDIQNLNFSLAFLGGLLTFLAPCVLPILPIYIGYISGVGVKDKEGNKGVNSKAFIASVFFVIGFMLVFISLGIAAGSIGGVMNQYRRLFQIIGGILLVIIGIHLTEIWQIKALAVTKKITVSNHITRYQNINAFLIGLAFGFSWTPCIGPILGVILFWASQEATVLKGVYLLFFFSLGLALPFLLLSLFTDKIMRVLRKAGNTLHYVQVGAGVLIIVLGLLLVTNTLFLLSSRLTTLGSLELYLFK